MGIKPFYPKTEKHGIYKHFTDVKNFLMNDNVVKDLIEDSENIIKYKIDLGILKIKDEYLKKGIKINEQKLDLIFYISGMSKKHNTNLVKELRLIENEIKQDEVLSKKVGVKLFNAYLTSNVMFDADIISIEEFFRLNQ